MQLSSLCTALLRKSLSCPSALLKHPPPHYPPPPRLLQGTLEMLQLGGGNDLSGTVPACLFDQRSALYFLGASSPGGMGGPRLTGALPDAFPAGSHLQMLDVASVRSAAGRGGSLHCSPACPAWAAPQGPPV